MAPEPESESAEFQYRLTSPMRISKSGDFEPVEFVLLKPPSSHQSKWAGALRQGVMQALREQMNNEKLMAAAEAAQMAAAEEEGEGPQDPEDEEEDNTEGHKLINMVAMAKDVDYPQWLEAGKKLLGSGVMLFNGGTVAKEHPIGKLGLWDLEEILGRYIQNFINTSPS